MPRCLVPARGYPIILPLIFFPSSWEDPPFYFPLSVSGLRVLLFVSYYFSYCHLSCWPCHDSLLAYSYLLSDSIQNKRACHGASRPVFTFSPAQHRYNVAQLPSLAQAADYCHNGCHFLRPLPRTSQLGAYSLQHLRSRFSLSRTSGFRNTKLAANATLSTSTTVHFSWCSLPPISDDTNMN